MDKLLERYKRYLTAQSLSENTMDTYVRQARRFLRFLNGRKPNRSLIGSYVEELRRQYGASTLNLYLTALNKYLCSVGHPEFHVRLHRVQKKKSLENVLSPEEYRAMTDCAVRRGNRKAYCLMRTLAGTGIRVGELSYITAEVLDRGVAEVWNKGKYREIYLPDRLTDELKEYCRECGLESGPVFLGSRGTPITRAGVWDMIQRMARLCGIPREKAHPHGFRHLFAKAYIRQYGNLPELADILGHSSVEITRIYTMSSVEEKRSRLDDLAI